MMRYLAAVGVTVVVGLFLSYVLYVVEQVRSYDPGRMNE